MAYVRKVKTKSGAIAVQVVTKSGGRIVDLTHVGSAHSEEELCILMALAKDRLHRNQLSLFSGSSRPLAIKLKQSTSQLLSRVLQKQYQALGFGQLDDPDFALLCIARMVEPTSKLDSLRVLSDLGITGVTKDRLYRCLGRIETGNYRDLIQQVCFAAAAKEALTLVLYDVTTLYFEIQKEDGYRKPGLSKERRLEPQIVVGFFVDKTGFPLSVQSFEGNTAETKTILPVLKAFQTKHHLQNITVVADAAMMSWKNLEALADSGYTYIVGSRLTKVPYALAEYQENSQLTDNQVLVEKRSGYRIIYQYKQKRASLDSKNLEKQVAKAERVVEGKAPTHRCRFVTINARKNRLNLNLIEKARALVGIKGYVTNVDIPNDQVIATYHQLFQVEASFRMSKSDLKARPIFHHKKEAIEAHLTIVLAALAIGRRIESKTKISLKQLINILKPIRSGTIVLNGREYSVQEEIPEDIHILLKKLNSGH